MFARVNEFKGTLRQLEDSVADTERISREVDEVPGSLGMLYLVDREDGKALAITLWESEQAMRASETQAGEIRQQSTQAEGLNVMGVGRYEVMADTTRVPAGHSR